MMSLRLFVLSFFPRDVLEEIWDIMELVSEDFLTYSSFNNALIWTMTYIFIYLFARDRQIL